MPTLSRKLKIMILATLLLGLAAYLAFLNGQIIWTGRVQEGSLGALYSPVIYTGFKGQVAQAFAFMFNGLMSLMGRSILWSVMALAALVELILLYPAIRLQLKQKKIHLLHKKLIDRFRKKLITPTATERELHKLYEVNEKLHQRGAFYFVLQLALFLFTFWGLSLIVRSPHLMQNSWSVLNFSLLSKATTPWLGVLAASIYLYHVVVKMYYKQKEDYLDPAQLTLSFLFSVLAAIAIYAFSQHFAVAMILYFVTLVTLSTVRYVWVEQHAKQWNLLVHQELVSMLRRSEGQHNRFEYFSRLWNHLPVVRHVNFNLLEEALSMTLGLLLVLTFLGAFGPVDGQVSAAQIQANLLYLELTNFF